MGIGDGAGEAGLNCERFVDSAEFEREVALVIRDRQGGQLLYEAHATNTGGSPSIEQVLPALFRAALSDFPAALPQPHAVSVDTSAP